MNPLFTLGEEVRFHRSSRFRKKVGDAKFPFYHSFVPVLMFLVAKSCRSRAESVHLLKPHLQWGKSAKSSNFVTPDDSARKRKIRKMLFWDFWSFQFQSRWQCVWDFWGFWGFPFTMQFTIWTGALRFLRFSISIALTRRLKFFCPTGTRDTIILLEGVPSRWLPRSGHHPPESF